MDYVYYVAAALMVLSGLSVVGDVGKESTVTTPAIAVVSLLYCASIAALLVHAAVV